MSILGGLEALLGIKPSVPPSAPPVPSPVPSQVSLLDKLLSERKTPASPIPTLPPAALANVLWPTGAPGGFDLRKAALAKMQEAGQLTPSEESLVITPGLSAPPKGLSGMFSRIEKAGRRKKPQEAPTSHMEAPDGGISSDELLKKLGINLEDFAKNSKVSEAARKAGVARSSRVSPYQGPSTALFRSYRQEHLPGSHGRVQEARRYYEATPSSECHAIRGTKV